MSEPLNTSNDPTREARERAESRTNEQHANAMRWRDEVESCRPPDSRGDVEGRTWLPSPVTEREVDADGRVTRLVLRPPGGAR